MPVVIGAPDIDDPLEAARFELVLVVGNVDGEVRGVAARPNQHVLAVIGAGAADEPDGAVAFRHESPVVQGVDDLVHSATVAHGLLGEPDVEFDSEVIQIASNLGETDLNGAGLECPRVAGNAVAEPPRTVVAGNPRSPFGDVVALVAIRRERRLRTERRGVVVVDAHAQNLHLVPGVVDVVLARDLVAARFEQTSQRIAHYAAAPGAGRERSRGIGADVLHLHAGAVAVVGPAVGGSGADDFPQLVQHPGVIDPEVDEPRASGFDSAEFRGRGQMSDDGLGDRAGRSAHDPGQRAGPRSLS